MLVWHNIACSDVHLLELGVGPVGDPLGDVVDVGAGGAGEAVAAPSTLDMERAVEPRVNESRRGLARIQWLVSWSPPGTPRCWRRWDRRGACPARWSHNCRLCKNSDSGDDGRRCSSYRVGWGSYCLLDRLLFRPISQIRSSLLPTAVPHNESRTAAML